MISRHSSRRQPLDAGFLNARLQGATRYDRIAGYFSSSILEIVGEALERIDGKIRVVCNSALSRSDVEVAKAAQAAMRREWCDSRPELLGDAAKPRFKRLHGLLRSGKMEIRVLPDEVFGLIHGKAGVITLADGRQTSFLGSANESGTAFRLNYELVWEDDSLDAVAWVQEEFDALWASPFAIRLADFIVEDLERLSRRELIPDLSQWREEPDPASVVVEAPVYRKEVGLWEHQKYFVKLAFDAHRGPHGARLVLADQVGLGKTLQLAMAAQLMALVGDKPVLVLAPKPLLQQWQDELDTLLGLPSAVWNGRQWVDERGIEHPATGDDAIRRCPRRVGIVSTGLVTRGSEAVEYLSGMRFECVHPYIRTIVLRTREYLETTVDPETGEPYLVPVRVRLHGESDADAIRLPPFLEDAYHLAEEFCRLLAERANSGFFRTMLLRRMGSTMEAGRRTVEKILGEWTDLDEAEDDDESTEELRTLTGRERETLTRLAQAMESNREQDPKYAEVLRLLVEEEWLRHGCIVFSQYFDSVWWLAERLAAELPAQPIGVYAGANRSGVMHDGDFTRCARDALKDAVRRGELRLMLGTDAASEGLNLQRLGSLINLDLPWNPSRLEQRKGRIQRIGQVRPEVDVYNMRYAGSVEDQVHELLSERLENISRLFGQLPDTLEDVWISVALGRIEDAKKTIDAVPDEHPFALRYHEVERVDWESCARVLGDDAKREVLTRGWQSR